jgi:hypothetical protein
MKLIFYTSFLFLLAPCNASKKAKASQEAAAVTNNLRSVFITYRTTACMGKCPALILRIIGEKNLMIYEGKSNTPKIGRYEKKISDAELSKVVDAFDKINFFGLKDTYSTPALDLPSKFITYTINGKTKTVEDQQQAPASLRELEKLLNDIAESSDWIENNSQE